MPYAPTILQLTHTQAFHLTLQFAAFATVLFSLELLALARQGAFRPGGPWAWEPIRITASPRIDRFDLLFRKSSSMPALLIVRIVCALCIIVAPHVSVVLVPALIALVASQLLLNARLIWGDDGADQMLSVVLIGAASAVAFGFSDAAIKVALLFIAAQSILSYFCSGAAKLFGPSWRDGTAFQLVMGHYNYGNRHLHRLTIAVPMLSRLMGYYVIGFQLVFPLFIVAPDSVAILLLAGGVMFHVMIALIMKLNNFLYSFLAAYPALIWARSAFQGALP